MAKNTPIDIIDIQQALADVRRSYRTLYTYQRTLLDLGRYIGQRLSLQYGGGWPKFSDPSPRGGRGSFDHWAWDWLNMYFYEFYYHAAIANDVELSFSVFIVSDSGYWNSPIDSRSRCELESFAPVESASTKVILMSGLSEIWAPDPLIGDDTWMRALFATSGPMVEEREQRKIVTQAFELHQFINAEMTDQCLNEFIANCNRHGVPMPALSSAL